ncbi:MAG: hypothetical protein M3445_11635, partial [Actinomycetota bacterium]|nr:hypothetical protein [Actinomycetota bacterium]
PSAWAREKTAPGPVRDAGHRIYDVIRRSGDRGKARGDEFGKQREWTLEQDPATERELPGGEDA